LAILRAFPTKTIILGVVDLADMQVESPESIAARIREALHHIPPERLMVAPDCGMKYLPRQIAYNKLCAMTLGTAIIRAELNR
jgi:5-methyltetrahydropteroyltriglutamate--homocysteine methyltransferase